VDVKLDKLIDELKVVVEVVLLLGVQHVTAVANGTLDHTASLVDGLDTDLELVDVVKGVEYSEDVDAILLSLVDKVVDGVVGERGVGDTVGASEKHLEGDVGYELSHTAKSVPGVFVEEAHGNIEGGASPALQTVEIGQSVAGLLGDVEKVDRSNTRRQERLVGIAPCGIHNHATLVRPNGLGESLGALLENNLAQTLLARLANIDLVAIVVGKLWEDNLALEFGLANLALDAAAVDGDITEVAKKLLGTVLTADKVEEGGGIVDKGGPAVSADKGGVGEEGGKEGNVGLHTTNAEFHEGSEHLPPGNFVGRTVASALDQHGVVVGSNDGTSEAVTAVKADTVATRRSVDLDLSGIGLESLSGIFGGDSALDGETSSGDGLLGEAKLLEGSTGGNLDLGGNNIDSGNLLRNCVFDLDTGVDLNKVVSVLLVNQELGGTGITIVDGLGQLDGIGQDRVTNVGGKVLCWGNLNDLLVPSLHGAVSLVQVNDVSVVVTEKLHLDMLGLIKEALNEDSSVTKSGLGLGSRAFERFLKILFLADDPHTTATTSISSLDDDREAVGIGEGLDSLEVINSIRGTRYDRHVSRNSELSSRDLVTEGSDNFGGGTDELEVTIPRELGVKLGV